MGEVAGLRRALDEARTLQSVLAILSMANLPMLREIERDYGRRTVPVEDLREWLAMAQLSRAQWGGGMNDLTKVTTGVVGEWARGTLLEWMDGFTDFRADWGGQFRLRPLAGQHSDTADPGSVVIEVTSPDGDTRRYFQVGVSIVEV